MKKIIVACSLILASGGIFAEGSHYGTLAQSGAFGNPDLGGMQYPVTMSNPTASNAPVTASLDVFQRGNPDGYDGFIEGYTPYYAPSGPTITSLDVFMRGNPDLGHMVDWSRPVVGSAEAQAIAAQQCRSLSGNIC